MALVMSLLATEQQDIMLLQGNDLRMELKQFNKVPMVSNMGMFTRHPDEPGVGLLVLQDITTLIKYCEAYRMGHSCAEGKFHLFTLSTFQKDTRKQWQTAYRDAPASTTGVEMGSKIYVAFLNLCAAFSTTSNKRLLQMAGAFSHNVRGFK